MTQVNDDPSSNAGGRRRSEPDDSYLTASQARLIWRKFRKHRLAIVAAVVLGLLYLQAGLAGFLSPTLPGTRHPDYKQAPPQRIRFIREGRPVRPFVYEIERQTDPRTFRRTFHIDESVTYPVRFFVRGERYKLLGLIPTRVHLYGAEGGPLFLLGTDRFGRDLFTRILYGSQLSLSIGLVGIAITFVLGLLLGGLSGYLGGVTDTIIQRSIDTLISVPTIPLWMGLAAAVPRDWPPVRIYLAVVIITSLIAWGGLARVVRGQILSVREEDFTMAARLAGLSHLSIIAKHLLPATTSYVIVALTLSIPGTILGETALSFLGLGLQPPVVSWGVLLQDAQNLETVAHQPWMLWPAAWIVVTVLMFNFLGDGLRDAADPYK